MFCQKHGNMQYVEHKNTFSCHILVYFQRKLFNYLRLKIERFVTTEGDFLQKYLHSPQYRHAQAIHVLQFGPVL